MFLRRINRSRFCQLRFPEMKSQETETPFWPDHELEDLIFAENPLRTEFLTFLQKDGYINFSTYSLNALTHSTYGSFSFLKHKSSLFDLFWRDKLTNLEGWFGSFLIKGYYVQKEVFNSKGDFTTSVEISPVFSELIAFFFINLWDQKNHLDQFIQ